MGASINKELVGEIVLWDNGKGGFVNRFGPNGEQFKGWPAVVAGTPAAETPGVIKPHLARRRRPGRRPQRSGCGSRG